ncbi:unnamed protein product [Medioppia subpectinata]|uniref:ENTH domain-containing protein n=1 Tax=Medioppia subpectinata TaxID=1979941 RepID=A0A7R9PW87_9ACAR|nr:unnamed protein product [Medioppia subpectinata]CAG2102635.1 unnamed protein product [Medioppia subpectinata]
MWKVRELYDKATNIVMNYTEVEAKVREATNDDSWGPTGQQMNDIASHTFTYEHFPEVMGMLWKRMLQDNRSNWRRTYKSLLLLSYLVKNGSERVVTSAREHIYDLRGMENYSYMDEMGKDQGINVRHRVKALIDFIQDDDKLREERKKAKKTKDKFIGVASDQMGLQNKYNDGWYDPPSRKQDFDEENYGRSERKPKKFEDNVSENSFEDKPESFDSESLGESVILFVIPFSVHSPLFLLIVLPIVRIVRIFALMSPMGWRRFRCPRVQMGLQNKYNDGWYDPPSRKQLKLLLLIPASLAFGFFKLLLHSLFDASAVSPKRTVKKDTVKKIDMGAAVNFGKNDTNSTHKHTSGLVETEPSVGNSNNVNQNQKSSELLLEEIFNTTADVFTSSVNNNNNLNLTKNLMNSNNNINNNSLEDFADFTAFQSTSVANNSSVDEFADFTTALGPTAAQTSQNLLSDNSFPMQSTNPFGGTASTLSSMPLSPLMSSNPMSGVLTPTPTNAPMNASANSTDMFSSFDDKDVSASTNVSQNNTWSDLSKNVNINVDNLMGSKYEKQNAPSMNQLARQVNNLSVGPSAQPPMSPTNHFGFGLTPTPMQRPSDINSIRTPQMQNSAPNQWPNDNRHGFGGLGGL